MSNMYDEKWNLKPEYALSESQKKSMLINNDLKKIDFRTDFGKGITFKSVDGRDWATYEEAMAYNQMYYEKMMAQLEKSKGMYR